MSNKPKPNVAVSFFTIHKVISRALEVSIEHAQTFSQQGFPNETVQDGFFNYLRAFVSVLQVHHQTEDELTFPYFKEKLPDMPVEQLTQQHHEITAILETIQRDLEGIEEASPIAGRLEEIIQALKKIRDIWHPHIQIEEEHFEIKKIGEMFPAEEHLRLIKLYGEYSQQHSGPAYLTIPFILYNLPPEIREGMAKGMPPELIEKLVPIVWKEKWASMRPFLLE